jgi:hypothetical protein
VLSGSDVAGYDLNDLMMPSLDTTMAGTTTLTSRIIQKVTTGPKRGLPGTNPTLYRDEGKETQTGQLMKLSNRAMGHSKTGMRSHYYLLNSNLPRRE